MLQPAHSPGSDRAGQAAAHRTLQRIGRIVHNICKSAPAIDGLSCRGLGADVTLLSRHRPSDLSRSAHDSLRLGSRPSAPRTPNQEKGLQMLGIGGL
jgi:hypothetical protein